MSDADEFIPTRRSLLSRLRNSGDQESWRVFFDTYWRLIYGAATKAGLNDAEAQDVVQETVLATVRRMPGFRYDPNKGSFKSWLLQATRWQIVAQLRKRERFTQSPSQETYDSAMASQTAAVENVADPSAPALEALWDQEWDRNLIAAALKRVKRKIDPKQYQAYDLYVLQGVPASKVARALKINLGRLYLMKHRINKLTKKEIAILRDKPI
jgi:RNA polymerase sigma factor (sigma-70 family)